MLSFYDVVSGLEGHTFSGHAGYRYRIVRGYLDSTAFATILL